MLATGIDEAGQEEDLWLVLFQRATPAEKIETTGEPCLQTMGACLVGEHPVSCSNGSG